MASWLEREFRSAWEAIAPDIPLVEEFSDLSVWESHYQQRKAENPHAKRWRADFAIPSAQVLIECQGAIWNSKGAHSRGAGLEHDFKKQYFATLSGWQVVLVSGRMVTNHEMWMPELAAYVRDRLAAAAESRHRDCLLHCYQCHPNPAVRPESIHPAPFVAAGLDVPQARDAG